MWRPPPPFMAVPPPSMAVPPMPPVILMPPPFMAVPPWPPVILMPPLYWRPPPPQIQTSNPPAVVSKAGVLAGEGERGSLRKEEKAGETQPAEESEPEEREARQEGVKHRRSELEKEKPRGEVETLVEDAWRESLGDATRESDERRGSGLEEGEPGDEAGMHLEDGLSGSPAPSDVKAGSQRRKRERSNVSVRLLRSKASMRYTMNFDEEARAALRPKAPPPHQGSDQDGQPYDESTQNQILNKKSAVKARPTRTAAKSFERHTPAVLHSLHHGSAS